MPSPARRSKCPVACTLDILGDRWSLLVIRDLMRGKRRYSEILDSPEGIPTNILAERLKRLVAEGVIRSRRYSEHPPRVEYELTAGGEELRPIMRAMVEWGIKHAGGSRPSSVVQPMAHPTVGASKRGRSEMKSRIKNREGALK